jgi:DNA-binding NarL/FixJ family response regulator
MPRILIVDDHSLYRKALRGALETLIAKSQVFEANNLETAQEQFEPDGSLDLVLVDLTTPGLASLEALRSVHECYPKTRFAAMAALGTRTDIVRSLEAGLFGFISKSQSDNEIIGAIRDILSGRIYVPLLLTQVDGRTIDAFRAQTYDVNLPRARTEACIDKLTRRQREILPLLARGMSNKEIARSLKIAEGTIKIHASSLLRVLGVRNRTEAAVMVRTFLFAVDQSISSEGAELDPASRSRRR